MGGMGGEGSLDKIPSVGEEWIFSGITHYKLKYNLYTATFIHKPKPVSFN